MSRKDQNMFEVETEALTVQDVAKILNVNATTIRKLIRNKNIGAIRVGGAIRIPKSKLLEFMGDSMY